MVRGFRERRRREQARRRLIALKWLMMIGGLAGLGWIAHATGSELARYEVNQLTDRIRNMEIDLTAIKEQASELQNERDEALERESNLRQQVPTGKQRELLALIRSQLDDGVTEERLIFLLRSAAQRVRCDGESVSKRFIVQTGITHGGNDWVAFAGSTIVVRASGEPARDDAGRPHAWFDETRPIAVTFSKIDGSKSEATGILPLYHSVARGDSEYRFVLTKSTTRGFLDVTAERCRLPDGG